MEHTTETNLVKTATALCDLLLGVNRNNDATSFPYWYVAVETSHGPRKLSRGIWFDRPTAQKYLDGHRYRYPKKAIIYCDSGHESTTGLVRAYDLAKQLRKILGEAVPQQEEAS